MKAAAIQLRVSDDRAANIERAASLIDEAASHGAHLVLLPELFGLPFIGPNTGPEYFRNAENLDGPSNAMAAERSKEHGITVVSSIFEANPVPGVYHNTCATYVSGELKSVYRKSHLPFSNGFPEKFFFRPGQVEPTTVDIGDTTIGTVICYERHFPELARSVALQGASVLMVPVASASAPMREVFQVELRAHGIFNNLFVVCANRIGVEGGKEYFGTSGIYGPDGEILAQAKDDADGEVVLADLDLDRVVSRRETRPFFRDRRPELYGRLTREAPPSL